MGIAVRDPILSIIGLESYWVVSPGIFLCLSQY